MNINIKLLSRRLITLAGLLLIVQGCASVNTFPSIARAGDTVSLMMGGSEKARKETTTVILTDSQGVDWDLQALGKVRSVFNLRMDAKSEAQNYTSYLDAYTSWIYQHEPVQSILVLDIPDGVPAGNAVIKINPNVDDDSSLAIIPLDVMLEIIPGVGASENFLRKYLTVDIAADLSKLEPAPYAKIDFGNDANTIIGAASLVVDFNQSNVVPGDLNVYVPESTVRGNLAEVGTFGDKQRMVYWRHDGDKLYIDIVAPQGIAVSYLLLYIIHPPGLIGSPDFLVTSSALYDVNGDIMSLTPNMQYYP